MIGGKAKGKSEKKVSLMKTLILIWTAAFLAASTHGQGTVAFINTSTTLLTTNFNPAGPSWASGSLLGAGNYRVGLFLGPPGMTDPAALSPVGYADNAASPGRFANTPLTVPYGPGSAVAFQVRAWSASLGADWATVSAKIYPNWTTGYPTFIVPSVSPAFFGWSDIGQTVLGGGAILPGVLFGTNAGNVGGFALNWMGPIGYTPEPSVFALGTLVLISLLVLRRRKPGT